MQIIHGINNIKKLKRPVVVLGVFDGVHRAHQRILTSAVSQAKRKRVRSLLITFWPHPQQESNIYSLEHRLRLIEETGIDTCVIVRFTPVFSRMTPEEFVRKVLVKKIGVASLFVGKSFTFGRNAAGDYIFLKKRARIYGFAVKVFQTIKIEGRTVSSTHIRRLILSAKLERAAKLLGRPVSILGTVIKGSSLARKLGYPTANIDPHHDVTPPSGVYAVKIIIKGKLFFGVCSIGTKPTFGVHRFRHIEVYIFNFNKNIYSKTLEIYFTKKIREQKKFSSTEDLSKQIKKDISKARALLSRQKSHHNICL